MVANGFPVKYKYCEGNPGVNYSYVFDRCTDDIKAGRLDILPGNYFMTDTRLGFSSPTAVTYTDDLYLYSKLVVDTSTYYIAILPFSFSLWAIMIIYSIMNGVIYFLVEYKYNETDCPSYKWDEKLTDHENYYHMTSWHLVSICKNSYKGTMSTFRGGHIGPAKTMPGKIIVTGNAVFSVMLSTLYISKLITFLTSVQPNYEFQSFEDINKLAIQQDRILNVCTNSTYWDITKKITDEYSNLTTVDFSYYLSDKVLLNYYTQECSVAIFWSNMINSAQNQRSADLCAFNPTTTFIKSTFVSILGSPKVSKLMTFYYRDMLENGYMKYVYNVANSSEPVCSKSGANVNSFELIQASSIYIILAIGVSVALIIFVIKTLIWFVFYREPVVKKKKVTEETSLKFAYEE